MTREPYDVYLIFIPDSTSRLPRMAWRYDAVVRAMDELGPGARVLRITEGELCRDLTHNFQTIEPDEYEDDETATRRWNGDRRQHFAFGRRSL